MPEDVVRMHKYEIHQVMDELAGIVEEEDRSFLSYSRKECLKYTCLHFDCSAPADTMLRPKLTKLAHAWNLVW